MSPEFKNFLQYQLILILMTGIYFSVLRIYNFFGFNVSVARLGQENCQPLSETLFGPNQLAVYANDTLLGTSNFNTLMHIFGTPDITPEGQLFAVHNASSRHPTVQKLKLQGYPDSLSFHPAGLYLRGSLLYVINNAYRHGGTRVEVFEISQEREHRNQIELSLTYNKSVLFEPAQFYGILNGLVVTGQGEMLVTVTQPEPDPPEGRSSLSFFAYAKRVFYHFFDIANNFVYFCTIPEGTHQSRASCQPIASTGSSLNYGIAWNEQDREVYVA